MVRGLEMFQYRLTGPLYHTLNFCISENLLFVEVVHVQPGPLGPLKDPLS